MPQITSGFRAIFSHPMSYNLAQWMIGAQKTRHILDVLVKSPSQQEKQD